jgi:hypothetical protein
MKAKLVFPLLLPLRCSDVTGTPYPALTARALKAVQFWLKSVNHGGHMEAKSLFHLFQCNFVIVFYLKIFTESTGLITDAIKKLLHFYFSYVQVFILQNTRKGSAYFFILSIPCMKCHSDMYFYINSCTNIKIRTIFSRVGVKGTYYLYTSFIIMPILHAGMRS